MWEEGANQTLIQKSLHLLGVACAVSDLNNIAKLSIGERDARLLQLREWMFGPRLINIANCPACAEPVEWETDLRNIRLQALPPEISSKEFHLEVAGFNLRFRLPNSHDLARAAAHSVYRTDPKKLLVDCILAVQHEQKDFPIDDLPDHVFGGLDQRMAEEDPQADIRMLLTCPVCSHQWEGQFDIVSYLWVEINTWARHMLQEVYLLARAFGWSEYDILNMSPQRRQLYLELLRT